MMIESRSRHPRDFVRGRGLILREGVKKEYDIEDNCKKIWKEHSLF